jgi:hypothetical protein
MKRALLLLACCFAFLAIAVGGAQGFGPTAQYVGSHTVVIKGLPTDTKDRGSVICNSDGASIGGGCIPFNPLVGDSIRVDDDLAGTAVAFQVCIDNNGDGLCGGQREGPGAFCADQLYYSHGDAGTFDNPLGPLPMTFRPGCPGGFAGYVVFVCVGIHAVEGHPPHQHIAPKGMITLTTGGTGVIGDKSVGDFCGGTVETPPKPYTVR